MTLTTVLAVVGVLALGAFLLLALEVVFDVLTAVIGRFRPPRMTQHYPGGPYVAASSGSDGPVFH